MTTPPATRSDAQLNRVRLVEAAHELFRERGLGVDVKEIAERAGVGIGTVYRNFGSKDELIAAVIDEIATTAEARFLSILDVQDLGERVERLIDTALGLANTEGALLQALADTRDAPPAHVIELVQGVFRDAQRAGVLRPDVSPQVMMAYFKLHFGLLLELRQSSAPDEALGLVKSLLTSAIHLKVGGCGR